MFNERVQMILDQTIFLIDKQKELFKFVRYVYADLLNKLDNRIEIEKDKGIVVDLNSMKDNINNHYQNLSEQLQGDIDFLVEQSKAIAQIRDMNDKDKAEELLNMLIKKEEELLDFSKFKKQVELDLSESMKDLKVMHEDLLNSLQEDNIKDLKLMLEALQEHESDLENNNLCNEESCSSCSGCSSGDGIDLFDFFKDDVKKDGGNN